MKIPQNLKEAATGRDLWFCVAISCACVCLSLADPAPESAPVNGIHAKARVLAIDNSLIQTHSIIKTGRQTLKVHLLNGPHAGQNMDVGNNLTGKMEFDEYFDPGDNVFIEYDARDGKLMHGTARGHYRLELQLALIVAFGILLLMVAGGTGFKAVLSFIFTSLVLWKLYFPFILKGWAPIPLGMGFVALITGVITFSVGGLNRRGVAVFAGSLLGASLTCALAVWFNSEFRLHGAVRPFAESLLYSGYADINLSAIFVASVFIASSGAVMDLAMDIAASMDEIHRSQPDIGYLAHIRSGLRVGRAVVGTMTTTLLLAYSSSHVMMFLVFQAKGFPLQNLLNAPFVAAEILNILVGSFGLVTTAPFTAIVAGLIYSRKKRLG